MQRTVAVLATVPTNHHHRSGEPYLAQAGSTLSRYICRHEFIRALKLSASFFHESAAVLLGQRF